MRKCRLSVCSSLENCISEGQKWEVLDDVYLPERIKKPRLTQREPKELSELSPWKVKRVSAGCVFPTRPLMTEVCSRRWEYVLVGLRILALFLCLKKKMKGWDCGAVEECMLSQDHPPVVPKKKIETKLITERMEDYQLKVWCLTSQIITGSQWTLDRYLLSKWIWSGCTVVFDFSSSVQLFRHIFRMQSNPRKMAALQS